MLLRTCLFSLTILLSSTTSLNGITHALVYGSNTPTKTSSEQPTVRVLVAHDQPSTVLEIQGKYKIFDPRCQKQLSRGFQGKRRLLQATQSGLVWGESFPGVHQILVMPEGKSTILSIDDREYKGLTYIYAIGGSISVVNQVPIEEYLLSCMSENYNPDLPQEMLAALAITSRTTAYATALNGKTPYFDVENTESGYEGYLPTKRADSITSALTMTKHMVLHKNNQENNSNDVFYAYWKEDASLPKNNYGNSSITLPDGIAMAKQGKSALQILEKAFPNTSLQLVNKPGNRIQ